MRRWNAVGRDGVLGLWNQNMDKSTDIKDLRERIDRMQNALQPLLKDN